MLLPESGNPESQTNLAAGLSQKTVISSIVVRLVAACASLASGRQRSPTGQMS